MTVLFDPPPLFARAGAGHAGDPGILAKRGEDVIEQVRDDLIRIGWPIPRRGVLPAAQDLNLVLDGLQCMQEGFAFGDPMLVDRDPGPFSMSALKFSVENGGRCSEHFYFREHRSKMGGWIRGRYNLTHGLEQARSMKGNPCYIVSAFAHNLDNRRRGSKSHYDPARRKPGSRHLWAEGVDNAWRTFGLTYREALNMGLWTGIGIVRGSARRELDCKVLHLDVGGLHANQGGSPTWFRPGGVSNPAIWWYG